MDKAIFESNLQSIFRMLVPLKVVVCSIKSVKTTSRVSKMTSPVMNTSGSLGSLVVNTPVSRRLGVFEKSTRKVIQKNFPGTNRPGSKDSPVYLSQGNLDSLVLGRLPGVFTVVYTPRSRLQILITPQISGKKLKSFPGISNGTRRSCLMKKPE